jgi:phosphoglycolate phosphatase
VSKHTLVLWDIDGTLISSSGAGFRAMERAFEQQFRIKCDLSNIAWAGRTDTWITSEILRYYDQPVTPENIQIYLQAYLTQLPIELANGQQGGVLPGVLEILETLHQHDGVAQGLLTGNQKRGAESKLTHYRVWDYFKFGAYADDSSRRNDLGPYALRRAKELHGVDFAPERTFIIGDTPHDIECGKVIGAKTIAVATGHHTHDELAIHKPTMLLTDLSDTGAFLKAVGV